MATHEIDSYIPILTMKTREHFPLKSKLNSLPEFSDGKLISLFIYLSCRSVNAYVCVLYVCVR